MHRQPCSVLHNLIDRRNWSRAIVHCHQHPQDARYEKDSETPLFLACRMDPTLELIRALLQANPEALLRSCIGYLPIHVICIDHRVNLVILQEFLIRQPTTACQENRFGKTPLMVMWIQSRPSCMKTTKGRPWSLQEHGDVEVFWEKVELLVDAYAISRQQLWLASDGKDNPPGNHQHGGYTSNNHCPAALYKIHGLISVEKNCPLEMLEYMCHKHPQELHTRDQSGQLPLQLIVSALPQHPIRKGRQNVIFRLLLSLNPQAARARLLSQGVVDGRYPLHVALTNEHTWQGGIRELFKAAPEVLSVRDPVTKLYPFQLAAVPYPGKLDVNMYTIFQLLRRCPDLMMG